MPTAPIAIALGLEYPLALRGGVSVLVETLIHGLAEHFRIVLVSPDDPMELARHPAAPRLAGQVRWEPGQITRSSCRQLAAELAERGVRLAHFHFGGTYGWGIRVPGRSPFPFLARAGIAGCTTIHSVGPILAGYCGPEKPLWFKLALFPGGWLGKLSALRNLRAEVAVSDHDARLLRRRYWPFANRIRQIYHSRIDGVPRVGGGRRKIILNVGHLAARKGQHLLVQAFARIAPRHPEWSLQIVGPALEAAYAEYLTGLAADAGLAERVTISGACDDVLAVMAAAEIYAQPSLEEALGLALQEALSAGCACVGAEVGGIPELIAPGENGLLFPRGDVSALAASLEKLIGDEALRTRLGAAGPPSLRARGMTATRMIAHHLALYAELLKSTA